MKGTNGTTEFGWGRMATTLIGGLFFGWGGLIVAPITSNVICWMLVGMVSGGILGLIWPEISQYLYEKLSYIFSWCAKWWKNAPQQTKKTFWFVMGGSISAIFTTIILEKNSLYVGPLSLFGFLVSGGVIGFCISLGFRK